ncbi:uncharacterized protein [Typha latifolia]
MSAAGDEDASTSPTASRFKLLCSLGGRILPRPSDGQLKYVGGETRVIAVPRSISFQEMKRKIEETFKAKVVVKYQLMSEDLDALVSVTCDEDLAHMRDEYDRYESKRSPSSSPRFRLFLFSIPNPKPNSKPSSLPPSPRHVTHAFERRYVDAINEPSSSSSSNFGRPIFAVSSNSGANSPTSASGRERGLGGGMHRVWSTPNLGGSAINQAAANSNGPPYFQQKQGQYGHYCRMGGPGRYEMCGCGCRVGVPPRAAGYYYPPAGAGGCVYYGHVDEHAPQPSSRRSASPFGARQRRPTIWD